jgi:hypothetical protein
VSTMISKRTIIVWAGKVAGTVLLAVALGLRLDRGQPEPKQKMRLRLGRPCSSAAAFLRSLLWTPSSTRSTRTITSSTETGALIRTRPTSPS